MGTMRINGVTFIESEVAKLSLDEFVAQNIDVFWKDISRERRKSRLVSVYNRIINNSNLGGGGDCYDIGGIREMLEEIG